MRIDIREWTIAIVTDLATENQIQWLLRIEKEKKVKKEGMRKTEQRPAFQNMTEAFGYQCGKNKHKKQYQHN